jgi:hypothetical protein
VIDYSPGARCDTSTHRSGAHRDRGHAGSAEGEQARDRASRGREHRRTTAARRRDPRRPPPICPGPRQPARWLPEPSSSRGRMLCSTSSRDAPACDQCGHITPRSGTCYKCLNCGTRWMLVGARVVRGRVRIALVADWLPQSRESPSGRFVTIYPSELAHSSPCSGCPFRCGGHRAVAVSTAS